LYAALISDLPTLLPACESWEDHLWAHIQARMESRLESKLKSLGGFWAEQDGRLGRDEETAESGSGDIASIFRNISAVQNEKVM
jgi:nuclear pore complex protein Nup107